MKNSTKKTALVIVLSYLFLFNSINAQEATHSFPEIKGYVGIAHPIYTFSKSGNTANFKNSYTVNFPVGINIWKTEKIGFSFEFTPTLRIDDKDNKISNFLFHPGILVRLGKGYTFAGRAAFETSGRYGFTPIITKVLLKKTHSNIFTSFLFPIRTGNNKALSFTPGILLGIGF